MEKESYRKLFISYSSYFNIKGTLITRGELFPLLNEAGACRNETAHNDFVGLETTASALFKSLEPCRYFWNTYFVVKYFIAVGKKK